MISQIRAFFAPARKTISRPMTPKEGLMQMRTFPQGMDAFATASRVAKALPAHADAVFAATRDGYQRLESSAKLRGVSDKDIHIAHLVFAPGTSRRVMQKKLPIGVKATQLGAASVFGRNGHLHVYAMVHIAGPSPARKVRFAVA